MKNITISAILLILLTSVSHSKPSSCNSDLHFIKCTDAGKYLKDPNKPDSAYVHEQCVLKDGTPARFGLFSIDNKYKAVVQFQSKQTKKTNVIEFDPSDTHSLKDKDRKTLQLPPCRT